MIGPLPPPIGGVESYMQALLESSAFGDFELTHCDTTKGRPKSTQGRFDPGNFVWAARHIARVREAVARTRPDVVYLPVAGTWAGFLRDMALARVARSRGAKLVGHVHGSDFHLVLARGGLDRAIVRAGLAQFDRILVLGERWREIVTGFGVRAAVDVVPSTFRREVFERAAALREAPAPARADGRMRVLFVGQVGRRKGTFDLLEALPRVRDAGADLNVTCVGPEELTGEWDALMALRDRLGVGAMTEFTGQLQGDALYARYRDADAFVLPSYTEGLPVVLFEAGLFGLPAITTPVGSIPDLIVDGRNGLLVPPGDRDRLVAALVRLARDRDERERMGRQLRDDVAAFHPDRVCAKVAAALQATLAA
ncbi:MAG: glycosyltransferase family 4 protein [Candidatus Eisenbacteria bacterium]|nr:glycosyltransferase family 4 protein [Candidatus Eisenbacteria bacterium]